VNENGTKLKPTRKDYEHEKEAMEREYIGKYRN
jgi:hypothetical protein